MIKSELHKIADNTAAFEKDFSKVLNLITDAKHRSRLQVNATLVTLYWDIGKFVHNRVVEEGWGKAVVQALSDYILSRQPGAKGFSARNLWRMKQFYETYQGVGKLPTPLTETTWSNHMHILAKTHSKQEREFYLKLTAKNRYSARELARLIDTGTYERTQLGNAKQSEDVKAFPVCTKDVFKDMYLFEFLNLCESYAEFDLKTALLRNLKDFLLELGPDFNLIKDEFVVQVGMKDYRVDLLLHHRGLNCLVAVELKVTDFKPEYLGKLQFYLEALDRDIKKPRENPSIGVLICKTKDEEVVEYAMSRYVSPTVVAEYETKLVNKALLQAKLREILAAYEDAKLAI